MIFSGRPYRVILEMEVRRPQPDGSVEVVLQKRVSQEYDADGNLVGPRKEECADGSLGTSVHGDRDI